MTTDNVRVPDGWQLVPKVPTPEMDAAGKRALQENGAEEIDDSDALLCYRDMLLHAPAPAGAETVRVFQCRRCPVSVEQEEPRCPECGGECDHDPSAKAGAWLHNGVSPELSGESVSPALATPKPEQGAGLPELPPAQHSRGKTWPPCCDELFTADQMRAYAALARQQRVVDAPGRYLASGPEGSFFTTDNLFAETLLAAAGRDRDEWTITDLAALEGERDGG